MNALPLAIMSLGNKPYSIAKIWSNSFPHQAGCISPNPKYTDVSVLASAHIFQKRKHQKYEWANVFIECYIAKPTAPDLNP